MKNNRSLVLGIANLLMLLLLCTYTGHTQHPTIDSLQTILPDARGAQRIETLSKLCEVHSEALLFQQNFPYASELFKLATERKDREAANFAALMLAEISQTSGEAIRADSIFRSIHGYYQHISTSDAARFYEIWAKNIRASGNYQQSNLYYKKAIDIATETGDQYRLGSAYCSYAGLLRLEGNFDQALKYYLDALSIGEDIGHRHLIMLTTGNTGMIYSDMANYEEALRWYRKAIEQIDELPVLPKHRLMLVYMNTGVVFERLLQNDSSAVYYGASYALAQELNDSARIASNTSNLGGVALRKGDYEKAIQNFKQAIEIGKRIDRIRSVMYNNRRLADAYLIAEQPQEALIHANEALQASQTINNREEKIRLLQTLANIYQKLANFEAAYEAQSQYSRLYDTLFAQQRDQQLANRIAYQEEKSKLETERLESEKEQEITTRNLIGGIAVTILIIGGLIFRQQWLNSRQARALLAKEKELDQAKSRFFANISHEFRTPLTLILGPATDLYQKATLNADKEELALIRNNAQRLLKLVNQILDLSKLESGKFHLKLIEEDVVSFVRRITASFQSLVKIQHIHLDFDPQFPQLSTPFDPDILEKTLVNLISNAVKYTSENGNITVSLEQQPDRIIVTVADTGTGISQDHLPHIFDRFYQAKTDDYTTHQPSTGIGLALVKELIELHGGEISAASTLNIGTTFTFWIPTGKAAYQSEDFVKNELKEVPEAEVAAMAALSSLPVKSSSTVEPDENQESVLIIEDNPDVLTYLKKCLGDSYQIIEAFDGKEGIEKAKQEIPDLIITDVMMPHKDGFAVTQELKANKLTHHIPIIILTGKSSRESKLEGLEKEAEEFLTKPFDAQELRLRIQGLLNNRKRLQEKFSRRLLLEASEVEVSSQEEVFLNEAISIVEANLGNEDFTIEQMASELHISRVQLFRKLKALTDQSPSRFIRSIRLKRAKQLIEGRVGTLSEIAYSVGFGSPTYFGKCFKEQYGVVPGDLLLKADS